MSACGTSFYKQCFPPESVHLGFSATAMHWLLKKPCNITGALHHVMITDENEKASFVKQAAEDWQTILLQRAEEIKEGIYCCFDCKNNLKRQNLTVFEIF